MPEESILNQIKSVCNQEALITEYAYKDSNKYFAKIRTKMEKEVGHSKWCDDWIKKFSSASATEWIVRYTYPSAKKYLYRKVFKCQHNSFDKVKKRKRSDLRVRDKGCDATVNILMKKINPDTIKNDPYLKKKLNIVITVNFDHSHNIMVAEAFSYLRMTLDTQKIFLKYFEDGMTPTAARTYHKMLLESQYDGPDFFLYLTNAQVNPTWRQVKHLYDKWSFRVKIEMIDYDIEENPEISDIGFDESLLKEEEYSYDGISPEQKKKFTCNTCKAKFKQKYHLNRHLIVKHSDTTNFECKICNSRFKTKDYLSKHSITHSNIRLFECDTCQAKFKQKSHLNRHLIVKHSDTTSFECNICKAKFKTKDYLETHLITHSDIYLKCDKCEAKFKQRSHLNRHILIHSATSFACNTCNAKFRTKAYLKRHLITHSNTYPFNCRICQAEFKHKSVLKSHILFKHSDERNFQCNICNAKVKTKEHLKTHLMTHSV